MNKKEMDEVRRSWLMLAIWRAFKPYTEASLKILPDDLQEAGAKLVSMTGSVAFHSSIAELVYNRDDELKSAKEFKRLAENISSFIKEENPDAQLEQKVVARLIAWQAVCNRPYIGTIWILQNIHNYMPDTYAGLYTEFYKDQAMAGILHRYVKTLPAGYDCGPENLKAVEDRLIPFFTSPDNQSFVMTSSALKKALS